MRADFEVSRDELLASDALDLEDGFSAIERRQTCGMLALRLDPSGRAGLIWLRPEQRREVVWGGDPDHATQLSLDAVGQPQLSPRSSFARWEQHVEGRSRAWTPADLAAARGLLVLQPVLALRDALAETRRSDSQFRSLVAVQADAYWQIDAGGTLVALSKPLRMLTVALLGRRLVDLLGPHLTPASFEMLNRALSRGEPFRDLHLSGSEPRDALPFELRVHGTPLRDAGECDAGWHGTLTDLSREMAQQRELAQRDAQQQAMLDNDLIAIIKVRDGRISWKNRAMDRLFGYRGDELIGQAQINLCADAAGVDLLGQLSHTELATGRRCRVQLAMRCQDGKCLWIDLSGMLLSPATQESMWLMNDISAMRALQEQAEHQARHDSLTRLPNRTLLLERLEQALASSARHGVSLALCFLDLDGFKPINDQHGHAAGDEVLRTLAQRLTVMVRLEDTVSRMGGDEFVLLLPHAGSRSELGALLQRLLAALALPVRLDTGILVRVTASAGVALSPADGIDAAALMLNADAALYAGKARGGNTVCFATDLGQRSE
jgi:diguanylate cyclase (GGDEF)-like protein/PAS domain S-box-containing protein